MRILTTMRKQTAVYWPPGSEASGGADFDDYGQPLYATPVELLCRWEDKSEEFINANGTRELSHSLVYVGQDVRPGGALLLSALVDVSDLVIPKNNAGAWEIKRFDKIPTLKADKFLRIAYL